MSDNQRIAGTSGNDQLVAGAGNELLFGLGGADTLEGGDGDDVLFGDGVPVRNPLLAAVKDYAIIYGPTPGVSGSYTQSSLRASNHDLLIINPAQSIDNASANHSETLWSAAAIADIRSSGKLVLGYINVTKINDYVSYWNDNWTSNTRATGTTASSAPSWLGALDTSDTSQSTRLINLSDPNWVAGLRPLLFARIDQMVAQGFNGIFLDDVVRYFVDGNAALTAAQATYVRDLVIDLAAHGRQVGGAGFIVVENGAPYILGDSNASAATIASYYASIDGILAENYFRYGLDEAIARTIGEYGTRGIALFAADTEVPAASQTARENAMAAAGFLPETVTGVGYNTDTGRYAQVYGEANPGADVLNGGAGNDKLIGGAGNDVLSGGSGADVLSGNAGADIFRDTAANLSGDTITDFALGDRINVSNATLAGFQVSVSGSSVSFTGGSLTLTGGVPSGYRLAASAGTAGGVDLTLVVARTVQNDVNGDGRSDIVWRNDNGAFTDWLGQGNGGFAINDSAALTQVPLAWKVAGVGDVNGDGRADIVWRNDNGALTDWLGQSNGGFAVNDGAALTQVSLDWKIAGVGDFNGDGRADLLWRNDNGALTDWLSQANGGFAINNAAYTTAPTSWKVAGVGDFNGDGRDDILWRNDNGALTDWLGQANGSFALNDAAAYTTVPASWRVAGVGDFNGDGRDDVLWRNDNGALTDWLGQSNGGFAINDAAAYATVPISWKVANVGDYNGDGRDDILWRNDNGALTDWLGQANGGFAINDAAAYATVPTAWRVADTRPLLGAAATGDADGVFAPAHATADAVATIDLMTSRFDHVAPMLEPLW